MNPLFPRSMWSFDAPSCWLSQHYDSCTNAPANSLVHSILWWKEEKEDGKQIENIWKCMRTHVEETKCPNVRVCLSKWLKFIGMELRRPRFIIADSYSLIWINWCSYIVYVYTRSLDIWGTNRYQVNTHTYNCVCVCWPRGSSLLKVTFCRHFRDLTYSQKVCSICSLIWETSKFLWQNKWKIITEARVSAICLKHMYVWISFRYIIISSTKLHDFQ